MNGWRAFLSSPEGRAAVIAGLVRGASISVPALAVYYAMLWIGTLLGTPRGLGALGWFLFSQGVAGFAALRISRWHDRQDRIERERSEQEN